MPVVQAFTEVEARTMKRVDQRSFHQARFIDRAARTVIGACCPFDHPVEYFELAELLLPGRDAFGAQVIYEGMLAGSRAHSEQGTEFFIKKIPFLFETIDAAFGFLLDGLFYGEEI